VVDLFTDITNSRIAKTLPLAARMRPQKVTEILGQSKILYSASPLRQLIEAKKGQTINSIILWGPSGSGKTTIAKLITNDKNRNFRQISAVTSGVSDVRQIIDEAKANLLSIDKSTILFIDEVHRFSKSQQDALLQAVENSIITLVAATTENPSFSIIRPLISRSLVVRLEALQDSDIKKLIRRAIKSTNGLNNSVFIEPKALDNLARISAGDARRALTILEALASQAVKLKSKSIDNKLLNKTVSENTVDYDAAADQHYDVASAFIKSLRGSDVDAALHYLARMISAGEDPRFIARRLIISAAEEIGMADPGALNIAVSAAQAVELVGLPEARIPLAEAVVYIATAPKSNAVYLAIARALQDIQSVDIGKVPPHLRDSHYKQAKFYEAGQDYIYAHDELYSIAAQQYLPDTLVGRQYYEPKSNGNEAKLVNRLANIRQILHNANINSKDKYQ
jgi:putative ATPase